MAKASIEGLDELKDKLKRLQTLQPVKTGLAAAGLHVKGRIAKYPRVSRRPQPFKTDRQRRFFFWAVCNKQIEVPYRRGTSPNSERLGQSWTIRSERGGLRIVVGNDASYGPLVQDRSRQALYHRETGWGTIQEVSEQEASTAVSIVVREVDKALA